MNNEIKEILKYLKNKNNTRNTKILTTNETNILLDYITNLQKENERLKQRIEKAVEYINHLSKEPNAFGHYGIHNDCAKWLLNILRGEDK